MPVAIANATGIQGLTDWWDLDINVPDTNGGNLTIEGGIWGLGQAGVVVIPQTTLAMPAAPGAGVIYINVQVDVTTGVATLQQSTVSDPAPINGNNRVVFRTQLATTSTDPALNSSNVTPDTV